MRKRIHQLARGGAHRSGDVALCARSARRESVGARLSPRRLASRVSRNSWHLDAEGELRRRYLASADRHRGVLAYLLGYYEIALDWFAQALEREPDAENLGNVLSTMIRLGRIDEAWELRERVEQSYPPNVVGALSVRIAQDDDLVRLRDPEA